MARRQARSGSRGRQPHRHPTMSFCRQESLLLDSESRLPEIFSLLASVRNCSRSSCTTTVSFAKIISKGLRIGEFPDSREIRWRQVRSTQHRQPTNIRTTAVEAALLDASVGAVAPRSISRAAGGCCRPSPSRPASGCRRRLWPDRGRRHFRGRIARAAVHCGASV
jgi:hypothetical protein